MNNNLKLSAMVTFALSATIINAHAMEKDTIFNMPADADFTQYYLSNELQPDKGYVNNAEDCMKACKAEQSCVVWTYKPGRFGSPNTCKLSPKLMQEKGEKTEYVGAASGVIETR
ncbi:MAG: hypothetical protein KDI92_05540 [Xanthomonadales bacterium]|nr:hypothetical protein [Xanthomonadales bacterium]